MVRKTILTLLGVDSKGYGIPGFGEIPILFQYTKSSPHRKKDEFPRPADREKRGLEDDPWTGILPPPQTSPYRCPPLAGAPSGWLWPVNGGT
eukprot:47982-Amorphochlora_amoeboformis.AAC.1